jgi:hypothetical protein
LIAVALPSLEMRLPRRTGLFIASRRTDCASSRVSGTQSMSGPELSEPSTLLKLFTEKRLSTSWTSSIPSSVVTMLSRAFNFSGLNNAASLTKITAIRSDPYFFIEAS